MNFEDQMSMLNETNKQLTFGLQLIKVKQTVNANCPNVDVKRLTNNLRLPRFV